MRKTKPNLMGVFYIAKEVKPCWQLERSWVKSKRKKQAVSTSLNFRYACVGSRISPVNRFRDSAKPALFTYCVPTKASHLPYLQMVVSHENQLDKVVVEPWYQFLTRSFLWNAIRNLLWYNDGTMCLLPSYSSLIFAPYFLFITFTTIIMFDHPYDLFVYVSTIYISNTVLFLIESFWLWSCSSSESISSC